MDISNNERMRLPASAYRAYITADVLDHARQATQWPATARIISAHPAPKERHSHVPRKGKGK